MPKDTKLKDTELLDAYQALLEENTELRKRLESNLDTIRIDKMEKLLKICAVSMNNFCSSLHLSFLHQEFWHSVEGNTFRDVLDKV